MRNGFYIIDTHCHIYPEKLAHKAALNISNFYGGLDRCGGSVPELLALMEQQGIDLSVVNSAAMTPHQVEAINHFILESAAAHPDKFVPLGTMHPDSTPEEMDCHIRFLTDNHLHGIKIHPDMLYVPLDSPGMQRIYALCQEADIPVLLHTGDRRYDNTNPNRLAPMLEKFPRLTFIGGHFGGRDFYLEAAEQFRPYSNMFADCSSSFLWLSPDEALRGLRAYGANRIMFGTDYPVCRPGFDLDYFFSLPLTPEEQKEILSGTAQKVFRFTAPWEK